MERFLDSFRNFFQAIHDLNEKYKTPRIQMTPMVNVSLMILRIYLLCMLVLLLYKFISTVTVH